MDTTPTDGTAEEAKPAPEEAAKPAPEAPATEADAEKKD